VPKETLILTDMLTKTHILRLKNRNLSPCAKNVPTCQMTHKKIIIRNPVPYAAHSNYGIMKKEVSPCDALKPFFSNMAHSGVD